MMPEPTPAWLGDLLAVAMIVTAVYCAARIGYARIAHRATHRDADALHVLMGIAMAGMLTRHLTALTPVGGVLHALWIAAFAVGAGWFAVRAAARRREARRPVRAANAAGHGSGPVVHLIGAAAMLYMLAATPAGGMAGMGGGAAGTATLPELGVALAVLATAAAVVILDRLALVAPGARPATAATTGVTAGVTAAFAPVATVGSGASAPGTAAATRSLIAPRTAECCHLLMCVVTAYMLIAMFA